MTARAEGSTPARGLTGPLAVVGTGLIGGSVGLAALRSGAATTVVGYDPDRAVLERAVDRGAVGEAAGSAAAAARGAALVVLAVPVDQVAATCAEVAPALADGAVVTDTGSAKAAVVAGAEAVLGERFVGGHPMAGSERHGIEAADGWLFEDAWWILTPTPATRHRSYTRVAGFVGALGARPVAVDPGVHDALVARLSHVPQLAASAIVELAAGAGDREALLGLAGPGFRDVTRIAASRPELWVSIIRTNRSAVLDALTMLGGRLEAVAAHVRDGRWDELEGFLAGARSARLGLFAKPDYPSDPVTLTLTIPDRPGVLAEVTTAAGRGGANIEEIDIVHSTEGGRGRLELVIAGRDQAARLAADLEALGYHVGISEVPA